MHPKDKDGITNSVDPDQTAPLGAVWSRSALFAQYLSVRKLRNIKVYHSFKNQVNAKALTCSENTDIQGRE